MFTRKYKEPNIEVGNAYKEIKNLKLEDESSIENVFKEHYDKIQNQKSNQEFTEFLKYRYNYLRNDLSMVLSVIFLFTSTCIPPLCVSLFPNNLLKDVPIPQLFIVILKALLVVIGIGGITSIIFKIPLDTYINLIFSNTFIRKQNLELKVIASYLDKEELIDYIDKRKLLKKGRIEFSFTFALSTLMWVLVSIFLS